MSNYAVSIHNPVVSGIRKKDADYVFYELTRSICPNCKKVIDAKILLRDNKVFMAKRCPDCSRWIRPHWQEYKLAEVRTIQVESWLRGLPLAKSSCAKIRNLMSVLFNHARYELFDRNPIYLVRQSAKRRTPPAILLPAEIKALVDTLAIR